LAGIGDEFVGVATELEDITLLPDGKQAEDNADWVVTAAR
jgi:uncharacterized protein (DUF849 family)